MVWLQCILLLCVEHTSAELASIPRMLQFEPPSTAAVEPLFLQADEPRMMADDAGSIAALRAGPDDDEDMEISTVPRYTAPTCAAISSFIARLSCVKA